MGGKPGASNRVEAAGQLGKEVKREVPTQLDRQTAELMPKFPLGVSEVPKDGELKDAFFYKKMGLGELWLNTIVTSRCNAHVNNRRKDLYPLDDRAPKDSATKGASKFTTTALKKGAFDGVSSTSSFTGGKNAKRKREKQRNRKYPDRTKIR